MSEIRQSRSIAFAVSSIRAAVLEGVAEIDDRELGGRRNASQTTGPAWTTRTAARGRRISAVIIGAPRQHLDRQGAAHARAPSTPPSGQRQQLIADVAVDLAAVLEDRLVDIEERRRDERMGLLVAQPLGERRQSP